MTVSKYWGHDKITVLHLLQVKSSTCKALAPATPGTPDLEPSQPFLQPRCNTKVKDTTKQDFQS
jgi:hypothetical protein